MIINDNEEEEAHYITKVLAYISLFGAGQLFLVIGILKSDDKCIDDNINFGILLIAYGIISTILLLIHLNIESIVAQSVIKVLYCIFDIIVFILIATVIFTKKTRLCEEKNELLYNTLVIKFILTIMMWFYIIYVKLKN